MRALVTFPDDQELAQSRPLAHAGRVIWERLPALLALDVAMLLASAPVAMLAFGGARLAALVVATLVVGPVWTGIVALSNRMVGDEAVTPLAFPGVVRSHAPRGIAITTVPVAIAVTLLGGLELSARIDHAWAALPLLAMCSLAIVVLAALPAAYTLGATGELRGWPLWRAAIAVATANPVATAGQMALPVLLASLASQLGLVVLMIAPAPFAVICSALTWSTVDRYRHA